MSKVRFIDIDTFDELEALGQKIVAEAVFKGDLSDIAYRLCEIGSRFGTDEYNRGPTHASTIPVSGSVKIKDFEELKTVASRTIIEKLFDGSLRRAVRDVLITAALYGVQSARAMLL